MKEIVGSIRLQNQVESGTATDSTEKAVRRARNITIPTILEAKRPKTPSEKLSEKMQRAEHRLVFNKIQRRTQFL